MWLNIDSIDFVSDRLSNFLIPNRKFGEGLMAFRLIVWLCSLDILVRRFSVELLYLNLLLSLFLEGFLKLNNKIFLFKYGNQLFLSLKANYFIVINLLFHIANSWVYCVSVRHILNCFIYSWRITKKWFSFLGYIILNKYLCSFLSLISIVFHELEHSEVQKFYYLILFDWNFTNYFILLIVFALISCTFFSFRRYILSLWNILELFKNFVI